MSENKRTRLKSIGRSASTESTELSFTIGRTTRRKKPKERWLLTRKTWRYMADAGRKLIPDGAQNRPEDIPKIESYFQEVCRKEQKFLLWRKNSYPGATGSRTKRKQSRKGGSYRKAVSEGDVDAITTDRPKDLHICPTTVGKYDLKKMRDDFLSQPSSPSSISNFDNRNVQLDQDHAEKELICMLERYLKLSERPDITCKANINYHELMDKLQQHLISTNYSPNSSPSYYKSPRSQHVQFQGDHYQKSLAETLSRYFGQSTNRDKVLSDLLTERKTLEKLYFDLRRTRGFRSGRGGTGYTSNLTYNPHRNNYDNICTSTYARHHMDVRARDSDSRQTLPLIEVENETAEVTFKNSCTQTFTIPDRVLQDIKKEYKRNRVEAEEEKREARPNRRRSSVDNDDVSQSVSDTIKRYLRMARKKSVDTEKADRFKRVNYDRNLRNIKAKGEISKPGDDDGLSKGCQTNDDWILTYRDLKFAEVYDISDVDSCFSSSRSSIDVGKGSDDGLLSAPSSPLPVQCSHSFFSHLHNKHDKSDKNSSAACKQKQGSARLSKGMFWLKPKSASRAPTVEKKRTWMIEKNCIWKTSSGKQVVLTSTNLHHLSQVESQMMQQFSYNELQKLGLKSPISIPKEPVDDVKKKKTSKGTTSEASMNEIGKVDIDGGLVFGVSLQKCIQNDKLLKSNTTEACYTRPEKRSTYSDSSSSEESQCEGAEITRKFPKVLKEVCEKRKRSMVQNSGRPMVPNIVQECIRFLENHALCVRGLFRVSSSIERIRQLRNAFDCGKITKLNVTNNPHDVANLLKEYFRELPQPLLCSELYKAFIETQSLPKEKEQILALRHLIQMLPPSNQDTLRALLIFLKRLANHSQDVSNCLGEEKTGNRMGSHNLAIVFAPNILHCNDHQTKDVGDLRDELIDAIGVIRTLIDNVDDLFYVSADSLHELYVWMMDTHQTELEEMLNVKEAVAAREKREAELALANKTDETGKQIITHIPFLRNQPDGNLPYTFEHVPEYTMRFCLSDEMRKLKTSKECQNLGAASTTKNQTAATEDTILSKLTLKNKSDTVPANKSQNDTYASTSLSTASTSGGVIDTATTKEKVLLLDEVGRPVETKQFASDTNTSADNAVASTSGNKTDTLESNELKQKFKEIEITKSTSNSTPEPKCTPGISSIGNAVMKSKMKDYENMIQTEVDDQASGTSSLSETNQKISSKKKYTDSRHPTRHIPDSAALESTNVPREPEAAIEPQVRPIYKRRQLISSAQP